MTEVGCDRGRRWLRLAVIESVISGGEVGLIHAEAEAALPEELMLSWWRCERVPGSKEDQSIACASDQVASHVALGM